jgi:hypothetical protein
LYSINQATVICRTCTIHSNGCALGTSSRQARLNRSMQALWFGLPGSM